MSEGLDKKIKAAEAYFDYLKTGKLLPLAELASENKFAQDLMLTVIAKLDSDNSYPWAIKKLPEKLKSKKENGVNSWTKLAAEGFRDNHNWKFYNYRSNLICKPYSWRGPPFKFS